SVKREGETLNLTPLEFDLLVALARKPRQVFTREVLLEQVWGYRHAADTRLVNVHVQRLRAKIEKDPEHPEIVVTVPGVGEKGGPGWACGGQGSAGTRGRAADLDHCLPPVGFRPGRHPAAARPVQALAPDRPPMAAQRLRAGQAALAPLAAAAGGLHHL